MFTHRLTILYLILVIVFVSGCIQENSTKDKEITLKAKTFLNSFDGKTALAEDKFKSGDFTGSLTTYNEIKAELENYAFNNDIESNTKNQIKLKYEQTKTSIATINSKLNFQEDVKKNRQTFTDLSKEFDTILQKEKAIASDYKYNPIIYDNLTTKLAYNQQCSNIKFKIKELNTDLWGFKRKLDATETLNDSELQDLKNEISIKLEPSMSLSSLMLADYENWCGTRGVKYTNGDILRGISPLDEKYYQKYSCSYKLLIDDEVNAETNRTEFLTSQNFTKLKQLILEKGYPFYSAIGGTNQWSVDYLAYFKKWVLATCDLYTTFDEFSSFRGQVKTKDGLFSDPISDADVKTAQVKLSKIRDVCGNFSTLETDCKKILVEYPKESIGIDCDIPQLFSLCESINHIYNSTTTKTPVRYSYLFGQ